MKRVMYTEKIKVCTYKWVPISIWYIFSLRSCGFSEVLAGCYASATFHTTDFILCSIFCLAMGRVCLKREKMLDFPFLAQCRTKVSQIVQCVRDRPSQTVDAFRARHTKRGHSSRRSRHAKRQKIAKILSHCHRDFQFYLVEMCLLSSLQGSLVCDD